MRKQELTESLYKTMTKKRVYESIDHITKEEAISFFKSKDPEKILYALLRIVYHVDDYEWVLAQCLHYANHPDRDLFKVVVICFSHIARIYHKIDKSRVLPILKQAHKKALSEGDLTLASEIEFTLHGIAVYTRKRTP